MTRIKTSVLALTMLGAFSCKQEARNKEVYSNGIESTVSYKMRMADECKEEGVANQKEEDVTKPIETAKDCDETFDVFFERFAKDSIFQKDRVKYPLKCLYYEDIDDEALKSKLIDYESFYYLDFTKDADAMNNEYGKYETETEKIDGTTVHYRNLGYDNSIYVTYKFHLIEGCWYLVEILDEST